MIISKKFRRSSWKKLNTHTCFKNSANYEEKQTFSPWQGAAIRKTSLASFLPVKDNASPSG